MVLLFELIGNRQYRLLQLRSSVDCVLPICHVPRYDETDWYAYASKKPRIRKKRNLDDSSGFHFSEISENAFDTVDTTAWEKISTEPSGAEIKHVLADPRDSGNRWFFKNNTVDERMRYGEDFAELLSSHIAPLLGISSATVYLAVHDGVEGIISLDVKPLGLDLVHGAVWLPSRGITDFVQGSKIRQGHSLANIKKSLDGVLPPPGGE